MTTLAPIQASPTGLERREYAMDDVPHTPTTPRATQQSPGQIQEVQHQSSIQPPPTGVGMEGQLPLPTSPFPGSVTPERSDSGMHRGTSQRSAVSSNPDSMDIDGSGDEQNASGDETEGGKSSKKKKGQRFFCTDFPPCNLSFTRSEHLARHIRKHTGERPFQCHCNRRFSRLDNLRQHAQTVHVNEDIPGDSLAATGTRFQRQIRTDRVRPPGGRPRSNTAGSQGTHSRGHSRNLSTSSISSAISNYSAAPEPRRRPPPLMMAGDPARGQMGEIVSSPTTPTSQYGPYSAESPGGYSTPTSTAYSTGPGSPNLGPNYASPGRSNLFAGPPPARRLSVPSTGHPFTPGHGHSHSQPYLSLLAPSSAAFSNNSSLISSPTSSTFSYPRGEVGSAADAEWRRRTWHPTSYTYSGNVSNYARPATSGLTYSQTPDAPQPHFTPNATAAAGPTPRLPGIESFDQVQHRPSTPPRRQPSPMRVDSRPVQAPFNPPAPPASVLRSHPSGPHHSRAHVSWDLGLHSTMNRLDLGGPPRESSWGRQTINEIQQAGSRSQPPSHNPPGPYAKPSHEGQHENQPTTPTRNKRLGWYNGPPSASSHGGVARTSPEDSSSSEGVPTPGTSNPEYRPAIVHHDGYIEHHHHHPAVTGDGNPATCGPQSLQSQQSYAAQQGGQPGPAYYNPPPQPQQGLGRLEALVAVATSENSTASTAR